MLGFISDWFQGVWESDTFSDVRRMNKRQVYYQVGINHAFHALNLIQFLNFAMIVSSALMVWKGLFVLSGTGSFFKKSKFLLDC